MRRTAWAALAWAFVWILAPVGLALAWPDTPGETVREGLYLYNASRRRVVNQIIVGKPSGADSSLAMNKLLFTVSYPCSCWISAGTMSSGGPIRSGRYDIWGTAGVDTLIMDNVWLNGAHAAAGSVDDSSVVVGGLSTSVLDVDGDGHVVFATPIEATSVEATTHKTPLSAHWFDDDYTSLVGFSADADSSQFYRPSGALAISISDIRNALYGKTNIGRTGGSTGDSLNVRSRTRFWSTTTFDGRGYFNSDVYTFAASAVVTLGGTLTANGAINTIGDSPADSLIGLATRRFRTPPIYGGYGANGSYLMRSQGVDITVQPTKQTAAGTSYLPMEGKSTTSGTRKNRKGIYIAGMTTSGGCVATHDGGTGGSNPTQYTCSCGTKTDSIVVFISGSPLSDVPFSYIYWNP